MYREKKRGRDDNTSPIRDKKKQRQDPSPLEFFISKVGEKTSTSLERTLEQLADLLERDMVSFKDEILQILVRCISTMPEKVTIYSTLIGLLNMNCFNFCSDFLDIMSKTITELIHNHQFEKARLLVRSVADLVNSNTVVSGSLFSWFDTILRAAEEPNIPQSRRDWLVYTVLSALPWVGKELSSKRNKESLERLLQNLKNYLDKRSLSHLPALQVFVMDTPHPQEDYLVLLWKQVTDLQQNNWSETIIQRPYVNLGGALAGALPHNLPPLRIPPHQDGCEYPLPQVVFRLFGPSDCLESISNGLDLPPPHSVERYVLEELVSWIISNNRNSKGRCAEELLDCPLQARYPIKYVIVEVILGQLFQLPKPPQNELFYGTLLLDLYRKDLSGIPVVIAQSVNVLYDSVDFMNVICFERFINWFSFHLNNFQNTWTWSDWEEHALLPTNQPKVRFIKEVLAKMLRLYYLEFLQKTLPEGLHVLLPPAQAECFAYSKDVVNQDPVSMKISQELIEALQDNKDLPSILQIVQDAIKRDPQQVDDDDLPYSPTTVHVVVQVLLKAGSNTVSSGFKVLAKFCDVLKLVIRGPQSQLICLKATYEFWKHNTLRMCLIIDRMVRLHIVECNAVINWVFDESMECEFTRMYIWEIVEKVLMNMIRYNKKATKEANECREKCARIRDKLRLETEESSEGNPHDITDKKQKDWEEMADKMDAAQSSQKQLFLLVAQRFIISLTNHLHRCRQKQVSPMDWWFQSTRQRLQQLFLVHHSELCLYTSTMENLLFTADVDESILDVFNVFKALRT